MGLCRGPRDNPTVKPRFGRRVVDGEVFDVSQAPFDDDTLVCAWLSGPNDYGFSIGKPMHFVPEGEDPPVEAGHSDDRLIQLIRDFLSRVDPETGYIE